MKGRLSGVGTLTPDKIEKIILLKEEGMFVADIARLVHCSKRTVYNYFYRLDLM